MLNCYVILHVIIIAVVICQLPETAAYCSCYNTEDKAALIPFYIQFSNKISLSNHAAHAREIFTIHTVFLYRN